MRRLGELEAEIMDRFWEWRRPATVREIVDDINRHRDVAYTTVTTVTTILFHKDFLTRSRDGRIWVYRAAATREDYAAALMADGLAAGADPSAVLLAFIGRLDAAERDALRRAVESTAESTAESAVDSAPERATENAAESTNQDRARG